MVDKDGVGSSITFAMACRNFMRDELADQEKRLKIEWEANHE